MTPVKGLLETPPPRVVTHGLRVIALESWFPSFLEARRYHITYVPPIRHIGSWTWIQNLVTKGDRDREIPA